MRRKKKMEFSAKVRDVLDFVAANPQRDVKGTRMLYLPLSELDSLRLPDVAHGLAREDVLLLDDDGHVHRQTSSSVHTRKTATREQEHAADVALAMLFLAVGGLDEAHDLVLPHSWSSPSAQGGAPVPNSAAAAEAKYCHALVHRAEGGHLGELGLRGWDNACFWFGLAGQHRLFPAVARSASDIAATYDAATAAAATAATAGSWNPDAFTELCRKAERSESDLGKMCAQVSNAEWDLLFKECYVMANPDADG